MTDKQFSTSVWLNEERRDKVKTLKEQLHFSSWGAVINTGIDEMWTKYMKTNSCGQAIVIDAKTNERLSGELLGLYDKKLKKLDEIDKKIENGLITEDYGKKLKNWTEENYKKSEQEIKKQIDELMNAEKKETNKTDLASIINKKMQANNSQISKDIKPYNPYADPNAYNFEHCGFGWKAKNNTDKCQYCGKMVQAKT